MVFGERLTDGGSGCPTRAPTSKSFFAGINRPRRSAKDKIMSEVLIQAYTWLIWKHRNAMIFNNVPFNPLKVANDIQAVVFNWIRYRSSLVCNGSWTEWVCNPNSSSL